MDVAVVRPAELTPAPTLRRVLVAAVVVLAVLATLAVLLLLARRDQLDRDDARAAAVAAARQEAVNLTSLDYRTAKADLDRILDGATGELRERFEAQRARLPGILRSERSVSQGSVLSAALVRLSDELDVAQVLVAVDATVSAGSGSAGVDAGGSSLKHFRMLLTLDRVGERWLARTAAFAGVPQ